MTRVLAAAVLLAACGVDKPDDSTAPPSPGTPSGSGTGTTTGNTTPQEDCADGTDNDGDGLLDCEDDDCATSPACFESDCADSADNDNDGLADCADEDCWGNGCEVTIASLATAHSASIVTRVRTASVYGSPYCVGSSTLYTREVVLFAPAGTVQVLPASGGAWTTCDWSARTSSVFLAGSTSPLTGPTAVNRNGFAIDTACPVQTSGFLPALWQTVYNTGAVIELRTGPSGSGPAWFRLNSAGSHTTTPLQDSTVIASPACTVRASSTGTSMLWPVVAPGADYTLAGF